MSQAPLCPNLSQKVQEEVSQMANRNLSRVILLGGLSVNLNHLITTHVLTKKACFGQYLSEFLTELPQTTTNHDMNHHDDPKRALHKAIWLPCYE